MNSVFFTFMHIYILYKTKTEIQTGSGGAPGSEERQCNAHNREKAQTHAKIDNRLECNHSKKSKTHISAQIIAGFSGCIHGAKQQ